MDFAGNLTRLMDRRGMSQADLARATQLSTAQIACLANGKTKDPRLSTVVKIARALDCPLDALVGADASHRRLPENRYDPDEATTSADEARASAAPREYSNRPPSPLEKALSESLKELMRVHEFDAVSVSALCDHAGVSRRSFYRHFLDKYDLLNYTFYQDLSVEIPHHDDWVCWDYMPEICRAFESDRAYYRHAYRVNGRNSFREYATTRMFPLIAHDLIGCPVSRKVCDAFIVQFFNVVYDNIENWIRNEPNTTAREFAQSLRRNACIFATVLAETASRPPRDE